MKVIAYVKFLKLTSCCNYLTVTLPFIILSFGIHGQTKGQKPKFKKSDIESTIIGRWIYQQDSVISSLRYIKTDSINPQKRGLIFYKDGKFKQQIEFGCQMPPSEQYFIKDGIWKVRRNKIIIIYDEPNFQNERMRLIELNEKTLRFIWK